MCDHVTITFQSREYLICEFDEQDIRASFDVGIEDERIDALIDELFHGRGIE